MGGASKGVERGPAASIKREASASSAMSLASSFRRNECAGGITPARLALTCVQPPEGGEDSEGEGDGGEIGGASGGTILGRKLSGETEEGVGAWLGDVAAVAAAAASASSTSRGVKDSIILPNSARDRDACGSGSSVGSGGGGRLATSMRSNERGDAGAGGSEEGTGREADGGAGGELSGGGRQISGLIRQ